MKQDHCPIKITYSKSPTWSFQIKNMPQTAYWIQDFNWRKNLYLLNSNFKWTSRFKLFELSHAAWQESIKQIQITHHSVPSGENPQPTTLNENPFPEQTNISHVYAGHASQDTVKYTPIRPTDNSKTQAIETSKRHEINNIQ